MSKENLDQFILLVLKDLSLQNNLKSFTNHKNLIEKIINLGAENSLEISREDIELKLRENRHLWNERWL